MGERRILLILEMEGTLPFMFVYNIHFFEKRI